MCNYRYGSEVPLSFDRYGSEDEYLLDGFDCGDPNLNQLIMRDASSNRTVSYLFINPDVEELIAYCSIACTGIVERITLDTKEVIPKTISSIEIDYFAVDKKYQHLLMQEGSLRGDTLGLSIFGFCINPITKIANKMVGAEIIVLYSVPSAQSFYSRNDFIPFRTNMAPDKDPFLTGCIPIHYVI